jgi:hypothetical protein
LLVFFILALGIFLVLIAPWPGLRTFHARAYRAGAELFFRPFRGEGGVWVVPIPEEEQHHHTDTRIVCARRDNPTNYQGLDHDAWFTAYLPAAKLIALVLATPIPWRRRWNALFWGLILVHVFIAVRLGIQVLHAFSQPFVWGAPNPVRLFEPGAFWMAVLSWVNQHFAESTTPVFMVPVFIWILVAIRREDLFRIVGPCPPEGRSIN